MPEYIDGDYRVVEHESGTIERILVTPSASVSPIVIEVSAAQAFTALDEGGHLDDLLAWVETLPALQKLQFQRIQGFRRDSPMLLTGAAALGLSEAQIDALFLAASQVVI